MVDKLYEALNRDIMPLCLKISILIDYRITGNRLKIRVAVPCCSNEILHQANDEGDKYYIIDIIS